jgi:hypothetical protein
MVGRLEDWIAGRLVNWRVEIGELEVGNSGNQAVRFAI